MAEERYVDTLVPGYIGADCGMQFGQPCLIGTRIPADTLAAFVRGGDSVEGVAASYGIDAAQVLAAVCFEAGVEWGRSPKRRKRMEQAVRQLWTTCEVRDG